MIIEEEVALLECIMGQFWGVSVIDGAIVVRIVYIFHHRTAIEFAHNLLTLSLNIEILYGYYTVEHRIYAAK